MSNSDGMSPNEFLNWCLANTEEAAQLMRDAVLQAELALRTLQATKRWAAVIGPPQIYGHWEHVGMILADRALGVVGRDEEGYSVAVRFCNSRGFTTEEPRINGWWEAIWHGQVLLIGKRLHLGTMLPGRCRRKQLGKHIVVPRELRGTDNASIEQDRRTYDSSP